MKEEGKEGRVLVEIYGRKVKKEKWLQFYLYGCETVPIIMYGTEADRRRVKNH